MTAPRPIRFLFLWLALAALVGGRAIVPTGWMPVADDDGIHIALCSGNGPGAVVVASDGTLRQDNGDDTPEPRETCPYGVLAQAHDLPGSPAISAPPVQAALPPVQLPPAPVMATAHAPRPPTRGPPQLA